MAKSSGETLRTTGSEVSREIHKLKRLTIPQLRVRYQEVFGVEVHVLHKPFLIRRIAWQLQAKVQGGLSERARHRLVELANGAGLGFSSVAVSKPVPGRTPGPVRETQRDPRLPPTGSLLRRRYRGHEIVVKVLDDGFECDQERFRSLSALARKLTGTRWNGLLFFGLTERRL